MNRFCILFTAFLVTACTDQRALIQKLAPKEDDELARRFVTLIKDGKYDEAKSMVDRRAAASASAEELNKLHQIVDRGQPLAFELVGVQTEFFSAGTASKRDTRLTYQVQFPEAWVIAAVDVQTNVVGRYVLNASFQPAPDSLQAMNRFTFQGKSAVHYLFFAACFLCPLFIIVTLIMCVRSGFRGRWLWIIFIVVALGQFQLNWTTGQCVFHPFSFLLLGGAGYRDGLYGALVVSFGIPVGAIIFLLLRHRLRRRGQPPPLPAITPT